MKRAALYIRVSTLDQHPEAQLHELRQFSKERGLQIVGEYIDHGISGTKPRRPALDKMMHDARHRRFDVVVVWACDRLGRSAKHFLQTLDELNFFNVQFLSKRECIDTDGPLGRAMLAIAAVMSEMERCILADRVRLGMARARSEGRRIGRQPLQVNRVALQRDRERGMSLNQLAKAHGISKASVCRVLKQEREAVSKGFNASEAVAAHNERLIPPVSLA